MARGTRPRYRASTEAAKLDTKFLDTDVCFWINTIKLQVLWTLGWFIIELEACGFQLACISFDEIPLFAFDTTIQAWARGCVARGRGNIISPTNTGFHPSRYQAATCKQNQRAKRLFTKFLTSVFLHTHSNIEVEGSLCAYVCVRVCARKNEKKNLLRQQT